MNLLPLGNVFLAEALFPEGFFRLLVLAALVWTALGVVVLLVLLVRDWLRGDLW